MFQILAALFISTISISSFGRQSDLKVGDIILQPLKCWSCTLIEQEEHSSYSHIGVVYSNIENKILVAEAYGRVQIISLDKFLSKGDPARKAVVKRLKYKLDLNQKKTFQEKIKHWDNHPYDRAFLWHNFVDGKEALYCSELVFKALKEVYHFSDLEVKVMNFEHNADYWDRYFRGNTPRGEIGISPEDFNKSSDFIFVKTL